VVGPATAGDDPPGGEQVEDQDMSDSQSIVDPMLEALLANMPEHMADDAKGIRDLFIVSGCSPQESKLKVVELYSPPG
jgi:hypothetical protein